MHSSEGEPLNSRLRKLASRNWKLRYIVRCEMYLDVLNSLAVASLVRSLWVLRRRTVQHVRNVSDSFVPLVFVLLLQCSVAYCFVSVASLDPRQEEGMVGDDRHGCHFQTHGDRQPPIAHKTYILHGLFGVMCILWCFFSVFSVFLFFFTFLFGALVMLLSHLRRLNLDLVDWLIEW